MSFLKAELIGRSTFRNTPKKASRLVFKDPFNDQCSMSSLVRLNKTCGLLKIQGTEFFSTQPL
ncbi:hypothetical protein J6590_052123 [Homalodisca vitripennis]|nr:hypothetical protein J6590_052123 [Homalodisca vitripennis]